MDTCSNIRFAKAIISFAEGALIVTKIGVSLAAIYLLFLSLSSVLVLGFFLVFITLSAVIGRRIYKGL